MKQHKGKLPKPGDIWLIDAGTEGTKPFRVQHLRAEWASGYIADDDGRFSRPELYDLRFTRFIRPLADYREPLPKRAPLSWWREALRSLFGIRSSKPHHPDDGR